METDKSFFSDLKTFLTKLHLLKLPVPPSSTKLGAELLTPGDVETFQIQIVAVLLDQRKVKKKNKGSEVSYVYSA